MAAASGRACVAALTHERARAFRRHHAPAAHAPRAAVEVYAAARARLAPRLTLATRHPAAEAAPALDVPFPTDPMRSERASARDTVRALVNVFVAARADAPRGLTYAVGFARAAGVDATALVGRAIALHLAMADDTEGARINGRAPSHLRRERARHGLTSLKYSPRRASISANVSASRPANSLTPSAKCIVRV
jgi:hypothetical protein